MMICRRERPCGRPAARKRQNAPRRGSGTGEVSKRRIGQVCGMRTIRRQDAGKASRTEASIASLPCVLLELGEEALAISRLHIVWHRAAEEQKTKTRPPGKHPRPVDGLKRGGVP